MHKISLDLKSINPKVHSICIDKNVQNSIVANGQQFNLFEYLRDPFITRPKECKDVKQQITALKRNSRWAKRTMFMKEFFLPDKKVYRLRKSTVIGNIEIPGTRLRAIMSTISTNQPVLATLSNKEDMTRMPKFIIKGKVPTIIPSLYQQAKLEQKRIEIKKALRRRKIQSSKSRSKQAKKPNILKSSLERSNRLARSVKLSSVVQTTNLSAKEHSNNKGNINRIGLAQKIINRRKRSYCHKFFGTLSCWRKFYKTCFRIEKTVPRKLKFEQVESQETGTLLSAQSENMPDPLCNSLPDLLSPDYSRNANYQLTGFPTNPSFNPHSFVPQSVS
jgi:hypothetical protein